MRSVLLFLILLAIWLLWSGVYKPLVIGLGMLSCAICVVLIRRMQRHGPAVFELGLILRVVTYLPWLIKEVAVSSWTVLRIVLHPRLPIDPVVVRVRASQRTELGRVVYGNSITLTPGTLTMDVDGEHLLVHALTSDGARSLETGDMNERVSRLESR